MNEAWIPPQSQGESEAERRARLRKLTANDNDVDLQAWLKANGFTEEAIRGDGEIDFDLGKPDTSAR